MEGDAGSDRGRSPGGCGHGPAAGGEGVASNASPARVQSAQKHTATGHTVVATAFPSATDAALQTLQAGGNAVDAAVAAAWALAVCEPSSSGLGGQTTLLVWFSDGKAIVIDGHSYAPAAVSRRGITKRQQRQGYLAATIPSTPATLGYVQKRYGRLPAARVLDPAIRLAEEGYRITRLQRRQLQWCRESLRASPSACQLFLRNGRPFRVDDIFRQKELAATLRRLASHGVEDFYRGEIARAVADDMRRHDGLITQEDLAACSLPIERAPLSIYYRGHQVASIPPAGGGLQVLLALKLLEQFASGDLAAETDRWYEIVAEATCAVFRERDRWPAHPRDLTPSLVRWLLSDERAQEIAVGLWDHGQSGANAGNREEAGETSHLCTADRWGNVVTLTQSIQSLFGAKVANRELGFLYNSYLCTCPRHRHPYQLDSRCVPRSNAAPTLVLTQESSFPQHGGSEGSRQWRPLLALGAAGSRRITSAILQVISAVIDRGLSVTAAVAAPRVHAALSREVWVEQPLATAAFLERIQGRFGGVRIRARHSCAMGAVQAIQFEADGTATGAADPRREGTANGV